MVYFGDQQEPTNNRRQQAKPYSLANLMWSIQRKHVFMLKLRPEAQTLNTNLSLKESLRRCDFSQSPSDSQIDCRPIKVICHSRGICLG